MARQRTNSYGSRLAARLRDGIRQAEWSPVPGARSLGVLQGVTPNCIFTKAQENVLEEAARMLLSSERIYAYGNDVVWEHRNGKGKGLVPLMTNGSVESAAVPLISNYVTCEYSNEEKTVQFPLPKRLVELLLHREPTVDLLPRIIVYAKRPLFDEHFRLCGPGWQKPCSKARRCGN